MTNQWIERFFSSTRGRIVLLLRRRDRTVSDLADELNLTDSAIRSQITKLERDDLVTPTGKRAGVRKPEITYGLTEQAETLFPKAYDAVLDTLLDVLADEGTSLRPLLRKVGRRLAEPFADRITADDPAEQVRQAGAVLEDLGGVPDVKEDEGALVIEGHNCPFGTVVPHHPAVCTMTESLLSVLIDRPVEQACDPDAAPPACRFICHGNNASSSGTE